MVTARAPMETPQPILLTTSKIRLDCLLWISFMEKKIKNFPKCYKAGQRIVSIIIFVKINNVVVSEQLEISPSQRKQNTLTIIVLMQFWLLSKLADPNFGITLPKRTSIKINRWSKQDGIDLNLL